MRTYNNNHLLNKKIHLFSFRIIIQKVRNQNKRSFIPKITTELSIVAEEKWLLGKGRGAAKDQVFSTKISVVDIGMSA